MCTQHSTAQHSQRRSVIQAFRVLLEFTNFVSLHIPKTCHCSRMHIHASDNVRIYICQLAVAPRCELTRSGVPDLEAPSSAPEDPTAAAATDGDGPALRNGAHFVPLKWWIAYRRALTCIPDSDRERGCAQL